MGVKGVSITLGQQGGIGYPPLVIKHKGKWFWVEDSRNHGGTICYKCSESRRVVYGFEPQRFGQPKPYGSECYRSLVERIKSPRNPLGIRNTITWKQFVRMIRRESGLPKIIKRGSRR